MKQIIVDKDKCIGCGACVGCEPDVFDFNDDGFAEVKNKDFDSLSKEIQESVESAIGGCPTEAISIEEKN